MTTALTISGGGIDYNLADTMELGGVLAKSGFFADTKEAAQAVAKILAGRELGIGPIAAMTGVYIVNGRVAIGANLMAAAVKRSGKYNYRVAEMTDKVCRVVFLEGGQEVGESAFTIEDAKRAGTKNIDKFPRNMLFARALSNGVRWYCPDVFDATVYTPDELRSGEDARPALPPAPAADPGTGEVIEDAPPTVAGRVDAEPECRYNSQGQRYITIRVDGGEYLIKNAAPELEYLEAGDEVRVTWHPETVKGRPFQVVDTLEGIKDADGLTDWEERAAAGATFEPSADAAAA